MRYEVYAEKDKNNRWSDYIIITDPNTGTPKKRKLFFRRNMPYIWFKGDRIYCIVTQVFFHKLDPPSV